MLREFNKIEWSMTGQKYFYLLKFGIFPFRSWIRLFGLAKRFWSKSNLNISVLNFYSNLPPYTVMITLTLYKEKVMEYMCNISIYIISIKHRISFYSENLNIQFSTNNLQGSNTSYFFLQRFKSIMLLAVGLNITVIFNVMLCSETLFPKYEPSSTNLPHKKTIHIHIKASTTWSKND